jgi:hypothetical protein
MDQSQKTKILKDALVRLMKDQPQLYYESTKDISYILHDSFEKGKYLEKTSNEDKIIIKKLTADDIHVLISHYN